MTNTFLTFYVSVCLALLLVCTIGLVRDLMGYGPHRSDNKRLRRELGWYADPEMWRNRVPDITGTSPASRDAGARARIALASDDDYPQWFGPGFIAAYRERDKL